MLTLTVLPANDQTITIGEQVYRWRTSLAAAYDVKIGANTDLSIANLVSAINLTGAVGTAYHSATVKHPNVEAVQGAGLSMGLEAAAIQTADIPTLSTTTGATWNKAYLRGSGVSLRVNSNSSGQVNSINVVHSIPPHSLPLSADFEESLFFYRTFT